jgi:hypothetical protein
MLQSGNVSEALVAYRSAFPNEVWVMYVLAFLLIGVGVFLLRAKNVIGVGMSLFRSNPAAALGGAVPGLGYIVLWTVGPAVAVVALLLGVSAIGEVVRMALFGVSLLLMPGVTLLAIARLVNRPV